MADVPAFIVLKALALESRTENKDAGDLVHVLRYSGTIAEIAGLLVEREMSGDYPGAVDAALAALRNRFCDSGDCEGYLKVGPVGYANFHGTGDEDERVRDQRFASGLVETFVTVADAMLAGRRGA